jgi:hypothetical protein
VLMRDRRVLTVDIAAAIARAETYRRQISSTVGGGQ